ncbi:MAG TPA: thioredoxin family protein [bacterium]|nr:thioredoxin family protein [bacterium]
MPLTLASRLIPFALPDTEGRLVRSEDFAAYPVFGVIFTCNHCPYAQAWEDRLIAIQRDYGAAGVRFVLINPNDPAKVPADSPEQMRERARAKRYPFPYLVDSTQEVARAYGATRTPEIFLFDRDRLLRYHGAPDDNYEDPAAVRHHYLRDALDALLAGRPPAVAETKPVGCTIKWRTTPS